MLKQHSQLMVTLLVAADAAAVGAAWLLTYWLRFTWLPAGKGVPELTDKYLPLLPLVVAAHLFIFYRLRLYRPRRVQGLLAETRDIVKAFAVAVAAVVLIDYALPASNKISRVFIATYAVMGTALFAAFRGVVRGVLQAARRRGWNRRTAAIVGTGRTAQRLLHALLRNTWTGLEVLYFVDDPRPEHRESLRLLPIRGPIADLTGILEREPVDSVFVALPAEQGHRVEEILSQLETTMADVRLVPEVASAYTIRPNVSELDGLAILSLRQTPLYGWNAILKRCFDLVVGTLCLIVASPVMVVVAGLIKLTSVGPVFYKQRRMGLDGLEFDMYKFRTMRVDAEAETGAVWASRSDPRRTRIGVFLRRTSLDELPNLFNVLMGQMSLVGPRPERPELIAQFRQEVPRYMLRHKMKAGMTGYAQVHGLRGNTSLRKRIRYDLHYIRNWSLGLDVRILGRTLAEVWFSRHEA